MKKTRLKVVFLLGILFVSASAFSIDTFFVNFKDNRSAESITKENFKKVTFPSGNQMLIDKKDGSSSLISIADIKNLTFEKDAPISSISTIKGANNNVVVYYPTQNLLTVNLPKIESCYIDIFNIQGGRLMQQEQTSNEIKLNVSMLPKGTYICRVSTINKIYVYKFVR